MTKVFLEQLCEEADEIELWALLVRQCHADRLLALRDTERDRDDLADGSGLAQTQRPFDSNYIERVHRPLDVGGLDPGLVRLDPHLGVVVDDSPDRDQRFYLFFALAPAACWTGRPY